MTPERLEVVGATLLALVVSRNLWWPGRYLSGFDTVAYSGPNLEITMDAWRSGRLPLWNDTIFGGIVHLANPQTGALYPPKAIALLVDTNQAMGLIVASHLVLLAVSTVFLLRRLGCRPPAAFAAAAAMTANGVVLTTSIQFEQIIVFSWIPALLLGITAVLDAEGPGRPWWPMAGTSIVTAMALIAGHPQITYHVVLVAAVWTAAMLVRRRSLARASDLGLSIGVGAMVAMPHLAAAVAGAGDASLELGRDKEQLLTPGQAVEYDKLLRVLWGTVRDVNEGFFANGFETVGHQGIAATILAAIGLGVLWSRRERALAVALGGLAALGIVWALGPRTIVFDLAFEILPGFDAARVSARWLDITTVATAIAVGFAVDGLVKRDVRPRIVLPAAVLGLVVALLLATPLDLPDGTTVAAWVVIAVVLLTLVATSSRWSRPAAVGGLVLVVALLELAGLSRGSAIDRASADFAFDDLSAAPGDALADEDGLVVALTEARLDDAPYLVPGFRPNTNTLADVRSLDGYDGGVQVTKRWVELIERVAENPVPELPIRNNLPVPFEPDLATDLFVRWMLLDNDRDPEAFIPGWEPTGLRTDQFSVWENPEWIGPAQARAGDEARALPVERPDPETVQVDVAGGGEEAELIVLDQQFAPGWTAEADGAAVDTVEADGFFLAAEVPPGTESVTFRYDPWWLVPSLIVSFVGIGLVVAALELGRRQARGGDGPAAVEGAAGEGAAGEEASPTGEGDGDARGDPVTAPAGRRS